MKFFVSSCCLRCLVLVVAKGLDDSDGLDGLVFMPEPRSPSSLIKVLISVMYGGLVFENHGLARISGAEC